MLKFDTGILKICTVRIFLNFFFNKPFKMIKNCQMHSLCMFSCFTLQYSAIGHSIYNCVKKGVSAGGGVKNCIQSLESKPQIHVGPPILTFSGGSSYSEMKIVRDVVELVLLVSFFKVYFIGRKYYFQRVPFQTTFLQASH